KPFETGRAEPKSALTIAIGLPRPWNAVRCPIMANPACFGLDPVDAGVRPHVNPSPSVFCDAPNEIVGQAGAGVVNPEMDLLGRRIVDPHQAAASGHPQSPCVVHEQGLYYTFGQPIFRGEYAETAIEVARQVAPIESHPDAAGAVFSEGNRGSQRSAAVALAEVLKPACGAGPYRYHIRTDHGYPNIAP